jgi:hypothetical protein
MEVLEQKRELDRETKNKVSFMVFIIMKFASATKWKDGKPICI